MKAYNNLRKAYSEFKALRKVPLLTRFRLLFKKKYIAFDWGMRETDGPNTFLFYKYLDGQVYIVGEVEVPEVEVGE